MASKILSPKLKQFKILKRQGASQRIELGAAVGNDSELIKPFNAIPSARRLPFIGSTLDLIAAGSYPK